MMSTNAPWHVCLSKDLVSVQLGWAHRSRRLKVGSNPVPYDG